MFFWTGQILRNGTERNGTEGKGMERNATERDGTQRMVSRAKGVATSLMAGLQYHAIKNKYRNHSID